LASFAAASPLGDASEPEIEIIAKFPDDNPFGQVVNGEPNKITLLIENKSEQNVTLMNVAGSFHDPETNALVKNTTSLSYGVFLLEGTKLQIQYTFHSEFKPSDVRLHIWVNHMVDAKVFQVTAYDSIVTVVEPEISFFDYQVVTTYLLTGAFLAALGYYAYTTFFPQHTKRTRRAGTSAPKSAISPPVGTVTAAGAGGYEEEWIPALHLKRTKSGRKVEGVTVVGALSSADELSGGETSGAEPRRRKGRK